MEFQNGKILPQTIVENSQVLCCTSAAHLIQCTIQGCIQEGRILLTIEVHFSRIERKQKTNHIKFKIND